MKLNYKKTVFVGFAFFLISAFWQAYDTIIPKILINRFGMNQSFSGVIMALDNIFALFLLPFFGALSDKCKSRRGRRTPFIIVGTVIAAVAFMVLSFSENMQLTKIEAGVGDNTAAFETLYDADLEINSLSEGKIRLTERFTKDEFVAFADADPAGTEYAEFVTPARTAYAWKQTTSSPATLVFFMCVLLVVLVSMSVFRSPAVALMPDVTIKPLRSKGNAVINLMGAAGGILVLLLGMILKTGSPANTYMSYVVFFACISALMLISLVIFLCTVNEPKLVREMQAESKRFGIDDGEDEDGSGDKKLSAAEKKSLYLILASVVFWYMGYNAVTSKYSVYAGAVLGLDYNLTLMIATGSAILTYLPVGIIASKVGRKKTILAGVLILATAFFAAGFMRAGSSQLLVNALFALAGVGWATINVNSFPMAVELATGSNVGKYTGYYYTASMAAQTITPVLSGLFLDIKMTYLFPYGTIFVLLSFFTMLGTKHGDSKPDANISLEALDVGD